MVVVLVVVFAIISIAINAKKARVTKCDICDNNLFIKDKGTRTHLPFPHLKTKDRERFVTEKKHLDRSNLESTILICKSQKNQNHL